MVLISKSLLQFLNKDDDSYVELDDIIVIVMKY